MNSRGFLLVFSLLLLTCPLQAEDDPWEVPTSRGVLLVAALTTSEKEYSMVLQDEPPRDVGGPERVQPPVSAAEVRVLDRCRKLIDEEKFERAEKILGGQVRKNKANYDAMALRALCLLKLGDLGKARRFLRQSIIGNRRNPEAWKILEMLAEETGEEVTRPKLLPRGWVRDPKDGEVEFGHADAGNDQDFPWMFLGAARAWYRHEGQYAKEFPREEYRYTFRELLFGVGSMVACAETHEEGVRGELARLLEVKKSGNLVPFCFFALYTESVPKKPEKHFDKLLPILEAYFNEHILPEPALEDDEAGD